MEANSLAGKSTQQGLPAPLSAAELDAAWLRWRANEPTESGRLERDLNAFGAAFGEVLVRDLEFEWQFCTDRFGSGLAVIALRGTGDATIFPTEFVSKRHERKEGTFFVESVAQIVDVHPELTHFQG